MLAGSLVVSWVTAPFATWTTLILLLSIHLETNRRAVRAVSMGTLNRQRATLVYHHLRQGHVPSPEEISAQERIFERNGVLRAADDTVYGHCTIGSTFSDLLKAVATKQTSDRSARAQKDVLRDILSTYGDRGYILWPMPGSRPPQIQAVLKQNVVTAELVTAWWQALALTTEGDNADGSKSRGDAEMLARLQQSMTTAKSLLEKHGETLKDAGWDLDTNAMETTASPKVVAEM